MLPLVDALTTSPVVDLNGASTLPLLNSLRLPCLNTVRVSPPALRPTRTKPNPVSLLLTLATTTTLLNLLSHRIITASTTRTKTCTNKANQVDRHQTLEDLPERDHFLQSIEMEDQWQVDQELKRRMRIRTSSINGGVKRLELEEHRIYLEALLTPRLEMLYLYEVQRAVVNCEINIRTNGCRMEEEEDR